MNQPRYQITSDKNLFSFEFVSKGKNGDIHKIVLFEPTDYPELFNLVLADMNIDTGILDDNNVSNNGDLSLILATVVSAIYKFTEHNPEAIIYIHGNSRTRNRLYRMCISRHLRELENDFYIFGETLGNWEQFSKDKEYQVFIAKRKLKNL